MNRYKADPITAREVIHECLRLIACIGLSVAIVVLAVFVMALP